MCGYFFNILIQGRRYADPSFGIRYLPRQAYLHICILFPRLIKKYVPNVRSKKRGPFRLGLPKQQVPTLISQVGTYLHLLPSYLRLAQDRQVGRQVPCKYLVQDVMCLLVPKLNMPLYLIPIDLEALLLAQIDTHQNRLTTVIYLSALLSLLSPSSLKPQITQPSLIPLLNNLASPETPFFPPSRAQPPIGQVSGRFACVPRARPRSVATAQAPGSATADWPRGENALSLILCKY